MKELQAQVEVSERTLRAQTRPFVVLAKTNDASPLTARIGNPRGVGFYSCVLSNIGAGPAIRARARMWVQPSDRPVHATPTSEQLEALGEPDYVTDENAIGPGGRVFPYIYSPASVAHAPNWGDGEFAHLHSEIVFYDLADNEERVTWTARLPFV